MAEKTTIDDSRLLKDAASRIIENEKLRTGMPAPLESGKIPVTEALKPAQAESDPLRLKKLYPSSFATFKFPNAVSSRIFNLNAAPSIGDSENIEEYASQIKKAKADPQETQTLKNLFEKLGEIEKNLQDIKGRINEFVLG